MIVRGQLFHRGENGEGNLIRTSHTLGKAQLESVKSAQGNSVSESV